MERFSCHSACWALVGFHASWDLSSMALFFMSAKVLYAWNDFYIISVYFLPLLVLERFSCRPGRPLGLSSLRKSILIWCKYYCRGRWPIFQHSLPNAKTPRKGLMANRTTDPAFELIFAMGIVSRDLFLYGTEWEKSIKNRLSCRYNYIPYTEFIL
jgi:hypothetical protein